MTTLLLDLIPGVDGKASAALQTTLLAPFTVADCSARWGFGNTDLPPSYGSPTPEELAVTGGKLGKSALEVAKAVSINRANGLALEAGLEAVGLKSLVKIPSNLKLATSAAAFGYGLYDAGIGQTDFSYQTVDDLRDTAGFSACMTAPYEKLVS
jgi:hypothetical protein